MSSVYSFGTLAITTRVGSVGPKLTTLLGVKVPSWNRRVQLANW